MSYMMEPGTMPDITAAPSMPKATKGKTTTVETLSPTLTIEDPIEVPMDEPMPELPDDQITETDIVDAQKLYCS